MDIVYFAAKITLMNPHIAIVSYVSTGAYDANTLDEDQLLSQVLKDLGLSHQIVAWSDPEVDWSNFSHLIIKSVWDYFDYYPEFLAWMDQIQALGIPALNDLDLIRWNSDKRYLLEIESKGFPTIAGVLLEKGSMPDLGRILQKIKTDALVIKPVVSGGAKNTLKIPVTRWDDFKEKVAQLLEMEDFLAQPFVKEVAEVGEYSLLFFNSSFSHAVLKTPAMEDFRVQHYFGGTIQVIQPGPELLAPAHRLMNEFGKGTLYGRVDGVLINGVFHLMELELIEPYLFLGLTENALPNYKKAVSERLLR